MKGTTDQKIDALGKVIEKGFAALSEDLTDVKEDISSFKGNADAIKKTLTEFRTDFLQFRVETAENFQSIAHELRDIKIRLLELEKIVDNHAGHAKEIDHALERIAAIEKHLGLNKRITA